MFEKFLAAVLIGSTLFLPSLSEAGLKRKIAKKAVVVAVGSVVAKKILKKRATREIHLPVPAPKASPLGYPGLKQVKSKTPVQGGGGLRKRWKDEDGSIYEWDSRHGTLEKYDRTGKHLGEYNPNTGSQIKPPLRNRRVEP